MKRALIWAIALLIWAGNSNGLEVHKTSILTTQGEKNLVVAQKTLHQTWNIFFLSPPLFRVETDLSLIGSENTNMYKKNVLIDSSRKIIFLMQICSTVHLSSLLKKQLSMRLCITFLNSIFRSKSCELFVQRSVICTT